MAEPTIVERLRELPRRSIVAFAARCARRVQPLFDRASHIPDFSRHRSAVETAIDLAEAFARGDITDATRSTARTAILLAARTADRVAARAALAALAALSAAAAASPALVVVAAATAAGRAAEAAGRAAEASGRADAIENDLRNLEALRPKEIPTDEREKYLGDQVDPSEAGPLGPLWPDGAPEWFMPRVGLADFFIDQANADIAAMKDLDSDAVRAALESHLAGACGHPSLKVYVDAGAANRETIRDLYLALAGVYEAQGGSGLKVVKHQQRALVGEEVPV